MDLADPLGHEALIVTAAVLGTDLAALRGDLLTRIQINNSFVDGPSGCGPVVG